MNSNKIFYGGVHDERLIYSDRDEYIESVLDEAYPDFPETITVVQYRPVVPKIENLDTRVLEYVLEILDEKYGDPEGDFSESTHEMEVSAKRFVKEIIDEYEPWMCEPIHSEEVIVAEMTIDHHQAENSDKE